MSVVWLDRDDPRYPPALLNHLGDQGPRRIATRGNLALLSAPMVALLCSVACPGDVILRTFDVARALRDAGVSVVGGFHAPMEQEALTLLLRGTQPVVVCAARAIEEMRLPTTWQAAMDAGRLLLLSPFNDAQRRVTAARARRRNEVVAALATTVFVAHAAPGGSVEALCRVIQARGTPLLTLEGADNAALLALGARPVRPATIAAFVSASLPDQR